MISEMNTLHNLQQQFSAALLGTESEFGKTSQTDNKFSTEEIIISDAIKSKQRLNIYRNNVNISLREALSAVYPVVNLLVGDEFFKSMAHNYIKLHPSMSGNLHDFGKHFSQFIKNFSPARKLIYLPDIAKLEWAYHSIFHAANSPTFDIEKLQQVSTTDYGELFFKLSPACTLIDSQYPILQIWKTNKALIDNPELEPFEPISLDEGGDLILVLRKDLDIEFHQLSACEFSFLKALQQGDNFFSACDAASRARPDCDVGKLFHKFILSQTIVDFEINP